MKSFYDGTHPLTAKYQELYDALVPATDEADTVEGEALRAMSRLGYEYYNNGNGNARESDRWDRPYYDGDDDYDDDEYGNPNSEINEFYQAFIDYLYAVVPNFRSHSRAIENIIRTVPDTTYDDAETAVYEKALEAVVIWIIAKDGRYTPAK
jgi:hypothetical protein